MKYTGPKAKRCRRQGVNIFGSDKYDKVLQRKPYPPGKGPRHRGGRQSEYARQLKEKQKARDMYGLSERQFRRMYKEASMAGGRKGDVLKQFLEQRLDNTIYRGGFALTRMQARQFVGHGLFLVDGVRVTSPSFRVKPGNKIVLRPKCVNSPVFGPIKAAHEKYLPPDWLKVDSNNVAMEVVASPTPEDGEQSVDTRQIIEFYSRV